MLWTYYAGRALRIAEKLLPLWLACTRSRVPKTAFFSYSHLFFVSARAQATTSTAVERAFGLGGAASVIRKRAGDSPRPWVGALPHGLAYSALPIGMSA